MRPRHRWAGGRSLAENISRFRDYSRVCGAENFASGFDRGIREPALRAIPTPIARSAARCEIPIAFRDFSTGCSTEKFPRLRREPSPTTVVVARTPWIAAAGRFDRVRSRLDRAVHRTTVALHPDWREIIRNIAITGIMTCAHPRSAASRSVKASRLRSRPSEFEVLGLHGHGGFPLTRGRSSRIPQVTFFRKKKSCYSEKETALHPSPLLGRDGGVGVPESSIPSWSELDLAVTTLLRLR